jgi:hypothetical protein
MFSSKLYAKAVPCTRVKAGKSHGKLRVWRQGDPVEKPLKKDGGWSVFALSGFAGRRIVLNKG